MQRIIEAAIEVENSPISEAFIISIFEALDTCPSHSIGPGDLSIALVDENRICAMHEDFLDDPTPTDVITFPADPEADFAGEIVVSYDQAIKEHTRHDNTVTEELILYLVHGWLHLAGEDDLDDISRSKMRLAESSVLSWLKPKIETLSK